MPSKLSFSRETEILGLSMEKFRWKIAGDFELIEGLFDDDLVFVHITVERFG